MNLAQGGAVDSPFAPVTAEAGGALSAARRSELAEMLELIMEFRDSMKKMPSPQAGAKSMAADEVAALVQRGSPPLAGLESSRPCP